MQESENAEKFVDSLKFLGFVDAPTTIKDLLLHACLRLPGSTERIRSLSPEKGQEMVTMAVEACTASLVLTGYVHADPHEVRLFSSLLVCYILFFPKLLLRMAKSFCAL